MLLVGVTISLMIGVISGVGSIDWVDVTIVEAEGVQISKRFISVMRGISVMELVVVDEMLEASMAGGRGMAGPIAP